MFRNLDSFVVMSIPGKNVPVAPGFWPQVYDLLCSLFIELRASNAVGGSHLPRKRQSRLQQSQGRMRDSCKVPWGGLRGSTGFVAAGREAWEREEGFGEGLESELH